ncbi:MAG: ESPR domain-containing protein [Megasphaera sp.]|nr:ESPR domain-containing protein [Megasphaera sp.]
MNKIYKVVFNAARGCYVVGSEFISSCSGTNTERRSISCHRSGKTLRHLVLGAVLAGAVLVPVFGVPQPVMAAQPTAAATVEEQYVAFAATNDQIREAKNNSSTDPYIQLPVNEKTYTYKLIELNGTKYFVRDGYTITVDPTGGKYTDLSTNAIRVDISYTGTATDKAAKTKGILEVVKSTSGTTGVSTNLGESLQKIEAGSYAGVSNSGGTVVPSSYDYIIQDSSWKDLVDKKNNDNGGYANGYADLRKVTQKGDTYI